MPKKPLISLSFEQISGELFSDYASAFTEIIGRSAGVYALFKGDKLYYVGRAVNLKGRVRQHLNDKHKKKWTHFSLYLINMDEHIGELESLLVRIANPKGNSVKPKGRDMRGLRLLDKIIRERQREKRIKLLHGNRKGKSRQQIIKPKTVKKGNRSRGLKGLVTKRVAVQREFKGKKYVGKLTPSGHLIYKNKEYETPTAAARVITKRTVNGWHFWRIKDKKGRLIRLSDY